MLGRVAQGLGLGLALTLTLTLNPNPNPSQERGADMFRMKGVLAIAHAKQRFVYHAVTE